MLPEDKFFETKDERKIWERYCGFLDLSIEDFMQIQRRLLMEQIEMVANSPLGKEIMKGNKPRSVEEFRSVVPLTTYEDYKPYLSEQREDVLTEKPYYWCHSAGRGGYFKWIPYTKQGFEAYTRRVIASMILASAKSKGQINLGPGACALLLMPPQPYASGCAIHHLSKYRLSLKIIPPLEYAGEMEFQDRIAQGFRMALVTGPDIICSIASVLVKVGESMAEGAQRMKFSKFMLQPSVLFRLVRALLRSKLAGRPIMPKDLWSAKALLTAGTDLHIYKDQIAYYWGEVPHEMYVSSEVFPMAMQNWNRKWLTFAPDTAFWEFVPEEELLRAEKENGYQPSTVLLNEIESGKTYEVVITHLYGMSHLRYRMGDLITCVASRDDETGVELPQVVFKARIGEIINLGGLAALNEKTVWQAIANSGIQYEDWSARKEYDGGQSYLSIYLELKKQLEANDIVRMIDEQLQAIDTDYKDVGKLIGLQPVRVTSLTPGTFQRYYEEKQKEGADLAHLKPPHMNASDTIIQRLLRLSQDGIEKP